jgi:error-prone DNA polymerase
MPRRTTAQRSLAINSSYCELHCLSNFSFLRGASHPPELVTRAAELGYAGLALTDECSVAGVVRAHTAAKAARLKLVVGSELTFADELEAGALKVGALKVGALKVVILAVDRRSYGALCRLISRARRAAPKGTYHASRDDLVECVADSQCALLWIPDEHYADYAALLTAGRWLRERFANRVWLAAELFHGGNDRRLLGEWRAVGAELGMPLVAAGNVHMHCRERRMLQDTLTAIRLKTPIDELGFELKPNAERCLRPLAELTRKYPAELLRETLAILERVEFSLDELRYEYPHELVPEGETPTSHLRHLTEQGRDWRWPRGAPAKVLERIEHELRLIADLKYEAFFLTVHDVVRFARSKRILCQGRGSAANSVVCFCLGITEVDPARMQTLVERFISKERNEPPDIDVDFEHERREEVIQYIYRKYSRERAALAATVISYRMRSAIRDVGKALGLDELQVAMVARSMQWFDGAAIEERRVAEAGFDPGSVKVRRWLNLVDELIGFPRHLSQHVGGFVIAERALDELVPVENAAMPERTVIQWDKDDLEELGLLKVDVLGLGMLSAIRRSFALIEDFSGRKHTIATVPAEDEQVYDMISRADTMGVFQIESRAQMAMLPRLRPRNYYDLVIEVAIIRPGPIQGDMVHPYLRRRSGEEAVTYPSDAVREVLERTLGVPIFQEQVMHLAMVAAGFTAGEADQLRRAMASWRRNGDLERFERRLIDGMLARNYELEFATRIFNQIKGFGEYGFPESHAASFALLVYVSAWLKHHEPAAFCCALLNSQPMGFYAPQQLVRNAREHGVEVRPVDVNSSDWDSTLERREQDGRPALRLGLHGVKGLSEESGRRLVEARSAGPFAGIREVAERAALGSKDMGALASAGAFKALASNRHRARWEVAGIEKPTELLPSLHFAEAVPMLRRPTESEDIAADYRHLGLTLGRHPLALLRGRLDELRVRSAREVADLAHGARVRTAGLVITRQRPSSASGVMFVTLEDESGYVNLVVWESLARSERRIAVGAALMGVVGKVQKEGAVLHVIAERLYDHSDLLGRLVTRSRDFH